MGSTTAREAGTGDRGAERGQITSRSRAGEPGLNTDIASHKVTGAGNKMI